MKSFGWYEGRSEGSRKREKAIKAPRKRVDSISSDRIGQFGGTDLCSYV